MKLYPYKIFFKAIHSQYQNKKALFTDPIFSNGFEVNDVTKLSLVALLFFVFTLYQKTVFISAIQ